MAGGSAIRGSRVGAGPMGEAVRGEAAPRIFVSFWCSRAHESKPSFAVEAEVPDTWDCPRCGLPAGPDKENPPIPPKVEPYKTHLAYVKERRTEKDGAAILQEAIDKLHGKELVCESVNVYSFNSAGRRAFNGTTGVHNRRESISFIFATHK